MAAFFAGAFLANAVPHFAYGICGDPFPTPFGKPPGKGLSSPTVNVLWGLFNLLVGCVLFRFGHVCRGGLPAQLVFFAGITVLSVLMSRQFANKLPR
ncbi:MAG TPA: hypothetical protein VHX60_11790 [Acidobacteriaceae bacterium]|nr:hypothetical protein [Acidobacteriaceae bacterium]